MTCRIKVGYLDEVDPLLLLKCTVYRQLTVKIDDTSCYACTNAIALCVQLSSRQPLSRILEKLRGALTLCHHALRSSDLLSSFPIGFKFYFFKAYRRLSRLSFVLGAPQRCPVNGQSQFSVGRLFALFGSSEPFEFSILLSGQLVISEIFGATYCI